MDFQRRSSRRSPWLTATVAVALGIVVIAAGRWGVAEFLPNEPTVDCRTLVFDSVRQGEFVHQVRCVGQLTSLEQKELPARTTARVERIVQLPGVEVTPNTLIVELSNPDLEAAVLDAESKLAESRAQLTTQETLFRSKLIELKAKWAKLKSDHAVAVKEYEVSEDLFSKDAFSGKQLEFLEIKVSGLKEQRDLAFDSFEQFQQNKTGHLAVYEERIAQALTKLEKARAAQRSLNIYAGIEGVLAQLPITEGQQLKAGELVAKVVNPKRLKAELRVAEVEARYIKRGQSANIDTRHGVISGTVTRVEPEVKEGSVTIDVTFGDSPMPSEARPDLSVTGLVEVERVSDVLFISLPASALADGSGQLYCLPGKNSPGANRSAQQAVLKNVEFGIASANQIVIRRGLTEGERVIISDLSRFDGVERIRLSNYSPSGS